MKHGGTAPNNSNIGRPVITIINFANLNQQPHLFEITYLTIPETNWFIIKSQWDHHLGSKDGKRVIPLTSGHFSWWIFVSLAFFGFPFPHFLPMFGMHVCACVGLYCCQLLFLPSLVFLRCGPQTVFLSEELPETGSPQLIEFNNYSRSLIKAHVADGYMTHESSVGNNEF